MSEPENFLKTATAIQVAESITSHPDKRAFIFDYPDLDLCVLVIKTDYFTQDRVSGGSQHGRLKDILLMLENLDIKNRVVVDSRDIKPDEIISTLVKWHKEGKI